MAKSKSQSGEQELAVVTQQTALAAASDYGDMAGAGFDNQTSDDVSVPFLGILQGLSPELNGATKIKGASAGNLINTVTKELFDGAEGIVFQPVDTEHCFVEWKPRDQGGGFVAKRSLDDAEVVNARAKQEFGSYKTAAGNDLIETFYITGLLHRDADLAVQADNVPEPMIIAFTSTKIKVYKGIMTRLRTVKGRPPMFAHRLRITTKSEVNNSNQPYENFAIVPAVENDVTKSLIPPRLGDDPHPLLVQGQALLQAYRSGERKANYNAQETGSSPAGGGDKPPF